MKKKVFLALFLVLLLGVSPLTTFANTEVPPPADDYVVSSDDIKSIRLVEMGWIEIIWNNDMYHQNDDPTVTKKENYKVMLGDEELVIREIVHWTPGWTAANPDNAIVMTNLRIDNWEEIAHHYRLNEGIYETVTVDGRELQQWNGTKVPTDITLQIVGDLHYGVNRTTSVGGDGFKRGETVADKSIVYDILYEPYYKKVYDHRGFKLRFSGAVDENTMNTSINNFVNTFDHMMKKSDDENLGFVEKIAEWGMTAVFSGSGENLHWAPDYRGNISYNTISGITSGYGAGPGDYPVVGFGNGASVGTLVHEIMHCVDYLAIRYMPEFRPWMEQFSLFYQDVIEQGMWRGTGHGANNQFGNSYDYALQNSGEFLARMATDWFQTSPPNNDQPTGREAMKAYSPDIYDLMSQLFYAETVPGGYDTGSTFRIPFLRKYVPNQNQGVGDDGEIAYTFGDRHDTDPVSDGHYFSILSFAKSHVITTAMPGSQYTTWWDFSHTSYNYDFNGLSWIITPVEIDGQTYYHFTAKGNNPLHVKDADTPEAEQFGDGKGIPGVFHTGPNQTVVTALGVEPDENRVGGAVRAVVRDLNDDNQLWSFVSFAGRAGALINKASGLTLGTEGGAMPGDGTNLVLTETSSRPANSSVWYLRQLKPRPTGGTASSLVANKYSVIADKWYSLMARTWFDKDDPTVIWIEWEEDMPADIAGNASNWRVTANRGLLDEKVFEIDTDGTFSRGNITRIKLMEEPTEVEYTGLGANGPGAIMRVQFTGEMNGLETGLPADNGYEYYFRAENYDTPLLTTSPEQIADIQGVIDYYAESGDISDELVTRLLHMHLTAVELYEDQERGDKIIKHMKGFKKLINQHYDQGKLSDEAFLVLNADAEYTIGMWE